MRVSHAAFTGLTVLLAACCSQACVRKGLPPVAAVDVEVAEVDGGRAPAVVAATSSLADARCSATLVVAAIKTGNTCTLDERVSAGPGLLRYPCQGDGEVEVLFKDHRFEGLVKDGKYRLDLTTEIDWEDGCHWETKQRIAGEWRREARTAKLVWTYTEGPVSGTGCYGACKASAEITVESNPGDAR